MVILKQQIKKIQVKNKLDIGLPKFTLRKQ